LIDALVSLGVILSAGAVAGCSGGDDGVDHGAVARAQAPLIAAAKKSGGDWSKLSPDEQKLFLDRTQGNAGAAKSMLGMMTRGPQTGGSPKR
jgi:hypothetical protein